MTLLTDIHADGTHRPSRRSLLVAGAVGSLSLVAVLSASSAIAPNEGAEAKFMELSRMLVPHRLDPLTGKRLMVGLGADHPPLSGHIAALLGLALERQASKAEDLVPFATQAGAATALAIISAWYLGVADNVPSGRVVANERALMFGPTSDAMTIPTYATAGPNEWGSASPPLTFMPDF